MSAPEWLRGFLLHEGLPYMEVEVKVEKNDSSLNPLIRERFEGVPFEVIFERSKHSNKSILFNQVFLTRNDPYKLVPPKLLNEHLLRARHPLALSYKRYYRKYLKQMEAGNFHLLPIKEIHAEARHTVGSSDGEGANSSSDGYHPEATR